jgi:hypothetical protein
VIITSYWRGNRRYTVTAGTPLYSLPFIKPLLPATARRTASVSTLACSAVENRLKLNHFNAVSLAWYYALRQDSHLLY